MINKLITSYQQFLLTSEKNKKLLEDIIKYLKELRDQQEQEEKNAPYRKFIDKEIPDSPSYDTKYVLSPSRVYLSPKALDALSQMYSSNESDNSILEDKELMNILMADLQNEHKDIDFSKHFNISVKGGIITIKPTYESIADQLGTKKEYIQDVSKEIEKVRNTIKRKRDNAQTQLVLIASAILAQAIKLCPKKSGYLARSGRVIIKPGLAVIAFTAPYSIYVHENFYGKNKKPANHGLHFTGEYTTKKGEIHRYNPYNCYGGEKFLERAVQNFMAKEPIQVEFLEGDFLAVAISYNIKDYDKRFKEWKR